MKWETFERCLQVAGCVVGTLIVFGVMRHGWKFFGPLVPSWLHRGEIAEVPEDVQERSSDRDDVLDTAGLICEGYDDFDAALEAADFTRWETELESRPRIRKHLREMERWNR